MGNLKIINGGNNTIIKPLALRRTNNADSMEPTTNSNNKLTPIYF